MSSEASHTCVSEEDSQPRIHNKYEVIDILGEGCFGKVLMCLNHFTQEYVALKVLNKDENTHSCYKNELQMLDLIGELDPDVFNVTRFIEHFQFSGHPCMVFELLDKSVRDLILEKISFSLNEVRPMAKQLLMALLGLQSVGVLHTDIKPDNILLVDHENHPFKVKLIDFGMARHISQVQTGGMQPLGYRALEVMLGLPVSEAVDMWSLACCLLVFYLGWRSLTSLSEYDNLELMVDILGTPSDELLSKGLYTDKYFVQEDSKWRLKTLEEYMDSTDDDPEMFEYRQTASLEELIKEPLESEPRINFSDREAFYDLLKKMFEMDPEKRISPAEALRHPFITMEHLSEGECYTVEAQEYMSVAETDFELPQREGLEEITEMLITDRKAATTKTSQETCQKASIHDECDGIHIDRTGRSTSSTSTVASCSSGSQVEYSNAKDTSLPNAVASSIIATSTVEGENITFEVNSDLEFAAVLEAAKKELPEANSEILLSIEKLFLDGEALESQIAEVKRKSSQPIFSRFRALISRFLKLFRLRPKKTFFRKPKWVERVSNNMRRSTMSGPFRH